jgi:hypothetical protein
MGKRKAVYGVFVRKPEGNRPLVIHRHRRGDNIKMGLGEVKREHGLY